MIHSCPILEMRVDVAVPLDECTIDPKVMHSNATRSEAAERMDFEQGRGG